MVNQALDVEVFPRDMLDDDKARHFTQPWLVQYPNGIVSEFSTEENACEFQRMWRQRVGLDPETGELQKEDD